MKMFAALLLALSLARPAAAEDVSVDVELVLAVDMSGSMDLEEKRLQRDGYVAAIASADFAAALREGAYRRIALSYLEWAGPASQTVVIDWRLVDGPEAARAFAADLAAAPLSYIRGTSISSAIDFAARMFDGNGFDGWRRVIDVSGDGANSRGGPVEPARDRALGKGIVINGLPLMLRPSWIGAGLAQYYADCVVGGPGHFVLPVTSEAELADAIRRKLVLEVAGRAPPPVVRAQIAPRVDCMVGERLRRSWDAP